MSNIRESWLAVLAACLAACGGPGAAPPPIELDSDADGLSDTLEAELGSDPNVVDSDGDGLDDQQEHDAGTDLLAADTDGDGYTDRDELHEGKDPLDDGSVIYQGGWPYYYEKFELLGGDTRGTMIEGKRFGRFTFRDHFGDDVNLFDFYNADKPVVIDVSALWCGPCQNMASWIGGEADPASLGVYWPRAPTSIRQGEVYWITVIGEGPDRGEAAVNADAVTWAEAFPSPHIPVLADTDYQVYDYVRLGAWPTLVLLEPDLRVSERNSAACAPFVNTYLHVLCELDQQFPE